MALILINELALFCLCLHELGFSHSIFEGDAEIIIKALVEGNCSILSIGHIVKDIGSMISCYKPNPSLMLGGRVTH